MVWTCKKNFSNNITFTLKNYADRGKCYMWLNVIQARLNTRQFWPAVSIICGWSWALAILQHFCWVIISLTFLSCVVRIFSWFFPPSFPFPLDVLWWVSVHFFTEVFCVVVPGGCGSQGCHVCLLHSPAAPFSFIRHLPYTHLLSMGLIKCYLQDQHNSSHHTQTEWNNCIIIPLKYFQVVKKLTSSFFSAWFRVIKKNFSCRC